MKKVIENTRKYFERQLNFFVYLPKKVIVLLQILMLFNSTSGQSTIFEEDFKDNKKGWEEGDDGRESSFVSSGNYVIKASDTDIWHWFSKPVTLRNETSWIIEADISIDSAKTANSFFGYTLGSKRC